MSKIGQKQIEIPENVKILEFEKNFKVTGPKGELSLEIPRNINIKKEDQGLKIEKLGNDKKAKSFHGLYHKLISNMIEGVSKGFEKKLDFKGVGFRAEIDGRNLVLNVGFSEPVRYEIPQGIEIKVEKNVIVVSGIDCQKVGQVAAEIRGIKPVEPYKGKGIKYLGEIPRKKLGKAAKAMIAGSQ